MQQRACTIFVLQAVLEALKGSRAGQHSIRVNDQYRVCFIWTDGDAYDVIKPPHPAETIKEDYLVPLGMSVNQLAKALGIGAALMNEIVRGERGITADTALRLAERKALHKIKREITPLQVA